MPKTDKTLRIPWTGEFTPGQLGDSALPETLAIVAASEGNRDQIVEAIRKRWFAEAALSRPDPKDRLTQQRTRSGNVLNGMQNYGLVDKKYHLTELGQTLIKEPDSAIQAEGFVRFLLKNRMGLELLDAVRELQLRGGRLTNERLRNELRQRGYFVTPNSSDAGKLMRWLGTAGVVGKDWSINELKVADLAGIKPSEIAEWQSLNQVERAFLSTIRKLSETRGEMPISSPELIDFVRDEYGPIFAEGQVKKIYMRLASEGWVIHVVKKAGRGGKGGEICATPKLIEIDFESLVGFRPGNLPADLRAVMTTPLGEIYQDLKSSDTHIKGIALKLLALNLATDLGLLPFRLRVRGVKTGGAEVDLVAEAAHLHFSRWLFNARTPSLLT